jgi:hypothetical protein
MFHEGSGMRGGMSVCRIQNTAFRVPAQVLVHRVLNPALHNVQIAIVIIAFYPRRVYGVRYRVKRVQKKVVCP